jgi:hypothetical protein
MRFAHAPRTAVRFGDRTYAPPWQILDVFYTTDRPGRRVLWVAWMHVQSGNFPCLLERLSPNGDVASAYWSAGYVTTVVDMVVQGRPSILVGAAHNDHRGASLAVFVADSVRGSAPAESADKTCVDCPPGRPRAFLVFPRMEFKRLVEGVPVLFEVRQQRTGELRVFVDQGYEPNLPATAGNVHYELDANLVPRHAEIAADYVATHRRLQSAGLLDHPFGDPDRREAWPVLAYNNDRRRFEPISGQTEK